MNSARPGRALAQHAALLAGVLLIFGPLLLALLPRSDYAAHLAQAERWIEQGSTRIPIPGFLFVGLAIALHTLLPALDVREAGLAVALGAYAALAIALQRMVLRAGAAGRAPGSGGAVAATGLTLALMLVMPFNLLTLPERNLYFGYVSVSTHHNPTVVLLKPFALLLFARCPALFAANPPRREAAFTAGLAALTVLGTLAKPNYTIALLPALGLLASARFGAGEPVQWRPMLLGVAAPATCVLGWQYLLTFAGDRPAAEQSQILIAPLLVMRALSPTGLAPKLALSILFPVCVYAAHFGAARRSVGLNLAWLAFLCGAFLAYFCAEFGPRLMDGNFLWSAQITLFVLFVASALFWLERPRAAGLRDGRFLLCAGVFALHLASGVVWYAVQLAHFVDPRVPILREWF